MPNNPAKKPAAQPPSKQKRKKVNIIILYIQDLQDLLGGAGVEVAGGLIGEDDRRLTHERPGAGHALDLATGELGGPVGQAVLEADGVHHLVEALLVDLLAGDVQGQGDVLGRRERGGPG